MTARKAKAVIADDKAALPAVIEAAAVIARDPASTLDELVSCLDRDGLAAEFAALELYHRTGREMPQERGKISLSRADWHRFLNGAGRRKVKQVERAGKF